MNIMESTKTVASMLLKSPPRATLKTRVLATELMKKRTEDRSKTKRNLIMNSAEFQILGNDNLGFSPSLLVSSEGNSYLFNCPEGTQRFCYTAKVKLLNLENIFLTSHDWTRVGGAFGLCLTLQDIGAPGVCVRSTDRIEGLFDSTRNFMQFTTGMKCKTESANAGVYEDSGIKVRPVILDGSISSSLHSEANDDSSGHELQVPKKAKCDSKLIAYICSFPDLPGALNPQKCKELNVPVGRHLASLKSGQDVELPDGRVILSTDVCAPKSKGLQFIVIECPSIEKIDYLSANTTLEQIRKTRKSDQEKRQIDLVIHFSPRTVLDDPRYREWMNGFADDCKHLLMSTTGPSRINFIDSYRLQYLLQKLDSDIFPTLYLPTDCLQRIESEFMKPIEERSEQFSKSLDDGDNGDSSSLRKLSQKSFLDGPDNIIEASSLDKFMIRPHRVVESVDQAIDMDLLYEEAKMDPFFQEELDDLHEQQKKLPAPKEHEPEVVFLGTGSALPSKLRNTTCILVNFHQKPKKVSVLLDCGEDSFGQIYRHYGPERTKEVLKQLKMIYVSHQHNDHHVGLLQILKQRREVTDEPVCLLLPPQIDKLLKYHNESFEDLSDSYEIFSTYHMRTKGQFGTPTSDLIKSELRRRFGGFLEDITIVAVNHCVNSCAVVMRFNIGHPDMKTFTIGYSGDARPSKEFVTAGKGCDLLIHEATFDHRSLEDALVKKHCTSTEAIEVARKMEAKFTILTHFSQRLPKIPYFTEDFHDGIGFAFDNLALRCPSHLCRLPLMKAILNNVFDKSISDIDTKYLKQQAKQQAIDNIIQSGQR